MHRKPHEVIIDDSLIAVSPRALYSELMCPICLDLMRNTQTTKRLATPPGYYLIISSESAVGSADAYTVYYV